MSKDGWDRRQVLQAMGAAGVTGAVGGGWARAEGQAPPNVVYVILDQLRASALHCYGDGNIRTPHIDFVGQTGVQFSRCYNSQALCTPSRATLLSGQFPRRMGIIGNAVTLPETHCIAHGFNDVGYYCGHIGKWHLDDTPAQAYYIPPGWRRRGFDHFWATHRANHHYADPYVFMENANRVTPLGPQPHYSPWFMTSLADVFFESVPPGQPFFLMLSYGPPHPSAPGIPWNTQIPATYRYLLDPSGFAFNDNVPPDCIDGEGLAGLWSGSGLRGYLHLYYASIVAMDHEIGKLVATMAMRGLIENTLFVFTADHGEMGGAHGSVGKTLAFEEANHVPLLMSWANRIPHGTVIDTPTMAADILPTIYGLVGLEQPDVGLPGRDLSEVVLNGAAMPSEAAFMQGYVEPSDGSTPYEYRMVRTDRWAYAEHQNGDPLHLFDMDADPYQMADLSGDPLYTGVLAELSDTVFEGRIRAGEMLDPITELGNDDFVDTGVLL